MKNYRRWLYWLAALSVLAVTTAHVQKEARAQSIGSSSDYGLIANSGTSFVAISGSVSASPLQLSVSRQVDYIFTAAGAAATVTIPLGFSIGDEVCITGSQTSGTGSTLQTQTSGSETVNWTTSSGTKAQTSTQASHLCQKKTTSTMWVVTNTTGTFNGVSP